MCNRIAGHQGSSPTTVFLAVKQLAKGTQLIAHEVTLLREEVRTLRKANQALAKRRQAKRTRVQARGALSVRDAHRLIARRDGNSQELDEEGPGRGGLPAEPQLWRRYGRCGKAGHNMRTCHVAIETSEEDSEEDYMSF